MKDVAGKKENFDIIEEVLSVEEVKKTISRLGAEIAALRAENRWKDIVELCYPLEEKWPELADSGVADTVVDEIIFALGQVKMFDEALELALKVARERSEDYRASMQVAYTAYASLQAASNGEILLPPPVKKERIDLAHAYFRRCERIRPTGVTCFYRHGVLYKNIQNKPAKARPLFERAVSNWDALSKEEKKKRHQERKNFIKALYQLSLCLIDAGENSKALELISRCINEDSQSCYLDNVNKYYTLGKVYSKLGQFDRAIKALQRATVDADPASNSYVFALMASCYMNSPDAQPQKALETIFRIPQKKLRPHEIRLKAEIYLALGKTDKARELLLKAAQIDKKGKHKTLKELAILEIRSGNFEKGLDYLKEADNFFRNTYGNPYLNALFLITALHIKQSNISAAEESLGELKSYDPFYPGIKKLEKNISYLKRTNN